MQNDHSNPRSTRTGPPASSDDAGSDSARLTLPHGQASRPEPMVSDEELAQVGMAGPGQLEALPPWEELSQARRQAVVEALLFAADQPLALKDLRELLGVPRSELKALIDKIKSDLAAHHRGLVLEEVAGGYVFRTRLELAPWLRALVRSRPPRLSRAAIEALAIVAYRQPVTRAEVEEIRGVESGGVLRTLLEKRMIRILGRKDDIGRPMIYGTSREFLLTFGLKDLTGLPTLKDLAQLGQLQGPDPLSLEAGGLEEDTLAAPLEPPVEEAPALFPLEAAPGPLDPALEGDEGL